MRQQHKKHEGKRKETGRKRWVKPEVKTLHNNNTFGGDGPNPTEDVPGYSSIS